MRDRLRKVALGLALLGLAGAAAAVEVTDAWTRETPPGTANGVAYLTLTNTASEQRTLLRVTTPAAKMVELHESSIDANGVARMWPVASLRLAPGQVVKMAPGGRHFMLMGLAAPLKAGGKVSLELQFDGGEKPLRVELPVRELVPSAPSAAEPAHHHHH